MTVKTWHAKPKLLLLVGVLLLGVALIIGLLGCGEETASSPSNTVEKFHQCLKAGNIDNACEYLTSEARGSYRGWIETNFSTTQGQTKYMEWTISNESVEGNKATVEAECVFCPFSFGTVTYELVLKDNRWLLNKIID